MTHTRRRALRWATLRAVVILAASSIVVSSAAAQKVSADFDETSDFSAFKTFAIREGQLRTQSPALNSELTRQHIEQEIERSLTAKGLMRVTEAPDLNVTYTLGSRQGVETETFPAGARGLRTRVARIPTTAGSLVIDLRNPKTRSLVWRGIATDNERDPAKLAGKLDEMVRKTLAKYPPKK